MSSLIYLFYSEFRETQRTWRLVPDLLLAICDQSVLTGSCWSQTRKLLGEILIAARKYICCLEKAHVKRGNKNKEAITS